MGVKLFETGTFDVVHLREHIPPQELFLQRLDGGAFAEGVGGPDEVGDEVQGKGSESDIRYVFVVTVPEATLPGAFVY